MPQDIFVTVHLTLNKDNIRTTEEALEQLAHLEVQKSIAHCLRRVLQEEYETLRNKAAELGLTLRFDLPVPYSAYNSVALETQDDDVPDGAGKVWMYVEPDGDLLPAQGMAEEVLGNLLRDEWKTILPRQMNWHARYSQQAKWTRNLRAYIFDKIKLDDATRVLEVGCGTGAILSELPASHLGFTVWTLILPRSLQCQSPRFNRLIDARVTHYHSPIPINPSMWCIAIFFYCGCVTRHRRCWK
ncbi:MAG: class I SAM-dependent methyltransferase [Candidatus Moduliflexus flocculans]|nr:class I SAM-dependent methyltransferase [Candidatus Moduliflexus flocculans]